MKQNPKLSDMMQYLTAVITSDPPVETGLAGAMMGQSYFPP